ncbi:MAG: DUF554 domain-containing protein [Eubacteriales bacterium]|nr:DUF554 domain-containing protein [Eubacteriales bacterium]
MTGSGTLINMAAIVGGGLIGLAGKRILNERIQETMMKANGLCVMFIGIAGALQKMFLIEDGNLNTQGTMVLIAAFALGSLLGELCNLELYIEKFGIWLREKSGNSEDAGFLNGFLTASFTVCIGAMAIVGSLQDGMMGDPSVLITKAILDFLIIMVMASALGKGCLFSAIPVGILQGTVTLLAKAIAPFMNDGALNYLSMTGSILIFCVGVNLIWKNTFKVCNMLPVVLVAAVFGMFGL